MYLYRPLSNACNKIVQDMFSPYQFSVTSIACTPHHHPNLECSVYGSVSKLFVPIGIVWNTVCITTNSFNKLRHLGQIKNILWETKIHSSTQKHLAHNKLYSWQNIFVTNGTFFHETCFNCLKAIFVSLREKMKCLF